MCAVSLYDLRIAPGSEVDVFRGWSHQSCAKLLFIAAQTPYPEPGGSACCRAVLSVWYMSRSNAGRRIGTDG